MGLKGKKKNANYVGRRFFRLVQITVMHANGLRNMVFQNKRILHNINK